MAIAQPLVSLSLLALTCAVGLACKGDPSKGGGAEGEPAGAEAGAAEAGGDGQPAGSGAASGPAKPAVEEGELPKLRTGTLKIEPGPAATATVSAYSADGAYYYYLDVPKLASLGRPQVLRVHMAGVPGAAAVHRRQGGVDRLFVRLPESSGPATSLAGTIFIGPDDGDHANRSIEFSATVPASVTADATLASKWAEAFAAELRGEHASRWRFGPGHPWHQFAAGRVTTMVSGSAAAGGVDLGRGVRPRRTELSELMHTTTAATSMQEALQHDRGLRLRAVDEPATVPIADLKQPPLAEHPWPKMQAALPDPAGATPEPLAAAAPADFWYVRFDDIRVLLRVLDEADTWITPVAHIMEERAEVRGLAKRYQAQLGLRRSGLAKKLGHAVVERVAIMGSDPYLREGSDVTFVFELSSQPVFDSELAKHLEGYRAEIPGIVESSFAHGEHTITVQRDPTGAIRQHRAQVGDYAIVSNSPKAITRVLDAITGSAPRLVDEPDLAYMLARDPGEHDGFAFLSDRFIAQVVGPQQKVVASRRQRALADLLTPGYAALLYGWLEGKAPADTEALIASGLLMRDELAHADGETITFEPGSTARSSWGSPSALTPIIDRPALTMVTPAEQLAYNRFAEGYQTYWSEFIDPVAIRIDLQGDDADATAEIDVRVLPLISGTDYTDLAEVVGEQRIAVPPIDDGLQMVWAVGAQSDLRDELDRLASGLTGNKDVGLGWLGDWVMVGTLDRRAVLDMVVATDDHIQLPQPTDDDQSYRDRDLELARHVGKLPVYAAAHVRNPTTLVGSLTAIRGMVNEVAPGMVQWGEHSRHRDYPIVRVGIDPKAPDEYSDFADAIALYYVQAGGAIVFALQPTVLHTVIDRLVDGGGPKPGEAGGPQFVVEGRLARDRASWLGGAWALQGQANRSQHSSRTAAEILLRGDPTVTKPEQLRALGLAYFGSYPVTASGHSDFRMTAAGVSDPVHGSALQPTYPALPVAGSPIDRLMARLSGVNASVSFDREPAKIEPAARSLHTHFRLHLGAPAEEG